MAWEVADLGLHATDLHKANIATRRNALQRRLDAWSDVQLLYMPSVSVLRVDKQLGDDVTSENQPENANLWLPSELPIGTPCDPRLRRIEWELCHVQAHDALNDVRRAIRVYAHLSMFRRHNV